MKVLIIEDDLNKSRQLADHVRKKIPQAIISEKHSYQSGLKEAIGDIPDLIILDMTMPTYEVGGSETGGRIRAFGGREILNKLKQKKIKTRVIVVTQFESFGEDEKAMTLGELNDTLKAQFSHNYICTVFYQASESAWREELARALDLAGQAP